MDAQTMNFLNLASDFSEYNKTGTNPITWTPDQREQFIKKVSENEPDKFRKHGYYLERGQLFWSVNKK